MGFALWGISGGIRMNRVEARAAPGEFKKKKLLLFKKLP